MKILIIEDESSIAENISYALSTEGHEPLWCETGREALEMLASQDIGFVILDVGLPDMNGFDLMRELRKTCGTPVLFLTARASEIDRVVGLELGADDYMVKPFSPRELVARVRAILRRASQAPMEQPAPSPAALQGPFLVDEARCMISYHGEPLELSRYEYRLLRALVENPGRVFSREQLMRKAWEDPDMSLERTIDTHIKTIRRKLKALREEDDPIITHRGFGYSLNLTAV
ncbi:MAG: two-component system response regulator CreB [Nitrospirae bacterium GWC2_57_13]|jgi:two-component system, OmpR family, catabolic regulation response regulator CreB|nr:MAG: two-component system response regulator CreB [Nitrospirae bacterium GWC2_57_13]OGW44214.1 MAG: two-component system response regulator CreB [Nitrospirae bacterium GWD2_57_8]HAS52937.1 two-component system response regulator CreB [Nitrospiraceae bacterium]